MDNIPGKSDRDKILELCYSLPLDYDVRRELVAKLIRSTPEEQKVYCEELGKCSGIIANVFKHLRVEYQPEPMI